MPLRNVPIRKKLMTVILVTSGAVVVLTSLAFFGYEYLTFRQSAYRYLRTLSEIVAANSTAALAFEDRDAAVEILSALRAESSVRVAALYNADGQLFAQYPADALPDRIPVRPENDGFRFHRARLLGFQPVIQGGQRLGTLYLRAGMDAMYQSLQLYALISLLVVGVSLILAYLLSRALQRQVSRPILALAGAARSVSEQRDYGVRVERAGEDEIGALTDAFNHMLTRIQEQVARLDLLNRITHAIGERQQLDSIFEVVIRRLEEHMPIDFGMVLRYVAADDQLELRCIGQKSSGLAAEQGFRIGDRFAVESEALQRCLRGALLFEPDASRGGIDLIQRLSDGGMQSVVLAPLAVEGEVFGVLLAARRQPHGFSSSDSEFLRQLSEHVALAGHQAQLHEALQQAFDDLRQTQQAAMQQERLRALGQMASGVAHDINNAISPVALYTEALLDNEPDLSDRARDYLETIQHAIDDVAATVARVREFYRGREDQLTLTPIDLNRLIQQVADMTRVRWNDAPQQRGVVIRLQLEPDPGAPPVLGVEGEIREALTNLIFNAVDAMPEGGTLTIRIRTVRGGGSSDDGSPLRQVRLEVSDTGVGMDEDTRRRALEPFYTTKGDRGSGLGLAMVYGMTRRHGAEIAIDSRVRRGTTIALLFPALEEPVVEWTPPTPDSQVPRQLRILVVDDDPMLLKSLRDTLEGEGHEVTTVSSGRLGLDAFNDARRRKRPFDVIITDLGMPYMDGHEVARAIKEVSDTPVILLTGWGQRLLDEGDELRYTDHLLSKPPRLRELREALAACCPHPQPGIIND